MLHASKYVMLCLAISVWYAAFVAGSFKRYDVTSTRYKLLRYILRVASKYGMHLRTSTSCDATHVEVASRYVMVCVASAQDVPHLLQVQFSTHHLTSSPNLCASASCYATHVVSSCKICYVLSCHVLQYFG